MTKLPISIQNPCSSLNTAGRQIRMAACLQKGETEAGDKSTGQAAKINYTFCIIHFV